MDTRHGTTILTPGLIIEKILLLFTSVLTVSLPQLNVTAGGGKEKTSPVTGYAVFADGKRVTDVDSPSSE